MVQKPKSIYVANVETTNSIDIITKENPEIKSDSKVANVAISANNDFDFIPQSVYDNLPKLLKDACSLFNDKHERDGKQCESLGML